MIDLKPCPFCEGSAGLHPMIVPPNDPGWPLFWAACERCSAEGPTAETKAEAAERWNRRPE